MAITKQSVTILAATSVAAAVVPAAPVAGSAVNVQAYAGGEWGYKITNGASAPGAACTIVLQTSHDGTDWVDTFTTSGNTLSSGVLSGSIPMSPGVMFARVIGYGNTTNAVTISSYLQARVG